MFLWINELRPCIFETIARVCPHFRRYSIASYAVTIWPLSISSSSRLSSLEQKKVTALVNVLQDDRLARVTSI